MHSFLSRLHPPLLIAHRGGGRLFPENTLLAFRMAVSNYGADLLELDIHATRDEVLVIHHDGTVERCTNGDGAIARMTFSELSTLDAGFRFDPKGDGSFPFRGLGIRIPALRDLLRALPSILLNIEVKPRDPEVAGLLGRLIAMEKAEDRVCVGSIEDAMGREIKSRMPDACLFYPTEALKAFVMPLLEGGEPVVDDAYQVIDMPDNYEGTPVVTREVVAAAHQRGIPVNVWTVDEPAEMEALFEIGVDGIMTDRPDLLRQVIDRPA